MLADSLMQGQIFTIFIITIAAAEVGIGLAIVLMLFRNSQTANINEFDLMNLRYPKINRDYTFEQYSLFQIHYLEFYLF